MKNCFNCGYFHPYYTKGYCQFVREKDGFCRRLNKVCLNKDECEQWKNNFLRRRSIKMQMTRYLSDALADISAIAQILTEEAEEEKVNPLPPNNEW